MVSLEYHKGQLCRFKAQLCQEGFCAECIISLEQPAQKMPTFVQENKQLTSKMKINKTSRIEAQVAET
jgi:hypothetical protein